MEYLKDIACFCTYVVPRVGLLSVFTTSLTDFFMDHARSLLVGRRKKLLPYNFPSEKFVPFGFS